MVGNEIRTNSIEGVDLKGFTSTRQLLYEIVEATDLWEYLPVSIQENIITFDTLREIKAPWPKLRELTEGYKEQQWPSLYVAIIARQGATDAIHKNNFDRAINLLAQGIEAYPNWWCLHDDIGVARIVLSDFNNDPLLIKIALESFHNAIGLTQQSFLPYAHYVCALIKQGNDEYEEKIVRYMEESPFLFEWYDLYRTDKYDPPWSMPEGWKDIVRRRSPW